MRKVLLYTALAFATTASVFSRAQTPSTPATPTLSSIALLAEAPLSLHPPVTGAAAAIMANPCANNPTSTRPAPSSGPGCLPPSISPLVDAPAAPLTVAQKGMLAISEFRDPGNAATMFGLSAATVMLNAHTVYGPGWNGFARAARYTAAQDATAEFFGTFLVPSLTHQDPRYRRMPNASVPRRALHAISASFAAQHDSGTSMPNYANLLTTPICAEISNLYVPGLRTNAPATALRVASGYATAPANNMLSEFLPDVARHVHIRVVFVQQMVNQLSNEPGTLP